MSPLSYRNNNSRAKLNDLDNGEGSKDKLPSIMNNSSITNQNSDAEESPNRRLLAGNGMNYYKIKGGASDYE